MAAVTCERSYIHRHMFPRARTSSPAKWASLAHVGGLASEGQLHKGKMNESGLPAGGRGKSLAKEGVVKIVVSTAQVVPSVVTRQIRDTRGKGKGKKKSHRGFNEKGPNQRLCAGAVIKSIKRLSSSSKSLT